MNITLTGKYAVKFRIFGMTLWTLGGSVNETLPINPDLTFRKNIDIQHKIDIVIEGTKTNVAVHVVFMGFPIYTQSFDLTTLVKGKTVTLPDFNKNGVTLTGMKLTVA